MVHEELLRIHALLLAVLVVAGARPACADDPATLLRLELALHESRRQAMRELLGESRWDQLRAARFTLDLHETEMGPPLADLPHRQEAVADSLLHCLGKLWRERLERRLRLEERRDRMRGRLAGKRRATEREKRGLSFSPRLRLGSHPSLGLKVHLPGTRHRALSGLAFRVAHELEGGDLALKMTWDSPRAQAYVGVHSGHRKLGRAATAGLRWTF